jgi:hypothetical protein
MAPALFIGMERVAAEDPVGRWGTHLGCAA